jgi:DNA-binding protein HU-beta
MPRKGYFHAFKKLSAFKTIKNKDFLLTFFFYCCNPLYEKPESCQQSYQKGGKMTKAELIEQMAKDAGISKVAAGAALESFIGSVTKALKKRNGKLTLVGFGTFKKVYRKTRKGRNPQTGELIKIKGKNVVKFTAGKKLNDAI